MSNANGINRRDFLKAGTGLLSTGAALPAAAAADEYKVKWYPFLGHPDSDTCWSVSVGPDGRIYAAACAEGVPGGVVKPVRYNEEKDDLDYLFDLGQKVDDPGDSGRATQCKIHYSFAPSMHDGIMFMATHLSGPPIDRPVYNPWYSWHDRERVFRGASILAFNTKTSEVAWWDTLIPKEGCRCLLHDEDRGLLYALSYPRDGKLYYVASRWRDPKYNPMPAARKAHEGVVWRLDPATLRREEVTTLDHPNGTGQYVSRGAVDHNGDLFFGHVGSRPSGIFKVAMPASRKKKNAHLPIRMWG